MIAAVAKLDAHFTTLLSTESYALANFQQFPYTDRLFIRMGVGFGSRASKDVQGEVPPEFYLVTMPGDPMRLLTHAHDQCFVCSDQGRTILVF